MIDQRNIIGGRKIYKKSKKKEENQWEIKHVYPLWTTSGGATK